MMSDKKKHHKCENQHRTVFAVSAGYWNIAP